MSEITKHPAPVLAFSRPMPQHSPDTPKVGAWQDPEQQRSWDSLQRKVKRLLPHDSGALSYLHALTDAGLEEIGLEGEDECDWS